MIELREYRDGDYEAIDDCVEPFSGHCDTSDINKIGVHFTAVDGDDIIGTGGVVFLTEDSGEIWLRLSKKFCKRPVTMMRVFRAGFDLIKESCELSKYTAKAQDCFPEGQRLIEKFGFRYVDTKDSFGFKYRTYEWT